MATAPRTDRDPRYDAAKRKEAAALYAELGSVRAVAQALEPKVSVRRAWELLVDAGVELRPVGRPKGEKA